MVETRICEFGFPGPLRDQAEAYLIAQAEATGVGTILSTVILTGGYDGTAERIGDDACRLPARGDRHRKRPSAGREAGTRGMRL
jgi:hypothetical protein